MKFASVAAASVYAASAYAANVACRVNGVQESVVDLDTGSCAFPIPASLPVTFDFTASDNYEVDAYYATVDATRFYNNVAAAGRTISILARDLYNRGGFPLFHVHAEQTPAVNSTSALRARFNSKLVSKRDAESDLVAYIKSLTGEAVDGVALSVTDPDTGSSASVSGSASATSGASTSTATYESTTIITVTSCSENKCSETGVSATQGPTTVTSNGETTVLTTWIPVTEEPTSTKTNVATTIVTITSCSDNKCHETTVPATEGPT
ncbi:hypothetical protein OXX69_012210, partial [Metschnikowia pulcherrima]